MTLLSFPPVAAAREIVACSGHERIEIPLNARRRGIHYYAQLADLFARCCITACGTSPRENDG